jgi:hypothetical protein
MKLANGQPSTCYHISHKHLRGNCGNDRVSTAPCTSTLLITAAYCTVYTSNIYRKVYKLTYCLAPLLTHLSCPLQLCLDSTVRASPERRSSGSCTSVTVTETVGTAAFAVGSAAAATSILLVAVTATASAVCTRECVLHLRMNVQS